MIDRTQPEALRLAELLELAPEDGIEPQTAEDAAAELRRLHAENEALQAGYAAARLEIESLQDRIKTMAEEHADELMVAHLDGMRAEQAIPGVQWQCGPQANGFTAPQADSQPAGADRHGLPPLPDPDLRDVGTTPGGIKEFLRGYATEYAKVALAARAPADSVLEDAARYRYLRDVPMELWPAELLSAIRLQQNAKWDAAIDAARAAQEPTHTPPPAAPSSVQPLKLEGANHD